MSKNAIAAMTALSAPFGQANVPYMDVKNHSVIPKKLPNQRQKRKLKAQMR